MKDKYVIAKRFSNYYKFLLRAKKFQLTKKLIRTNLYVNKILPKHDKKGDNSWSTPKEFLTNGYGDCEDYAITKYVTLLELDIDIKKLFLSVVKVKGSTSLHMVLLYKNGTNILVLDNLSWKVLPLYQRGDLIFKYAFNNKHSFIIKNNKFYLEKNKRRIETIMLNNILLER